MPEKPFGVAPTRMLPGISLPNVDGPATGDMESAPPAPRRRLAATISAKAPTNMNDTTAAAPMPPNTSHRAVELLRWPALTGGVAWAADDSSAPLVTGW
jgi:hypothetical protein